MGAAAAPPAVDVAVVVAVLVLLALSVLQVLVAAGRPYGRFVWGGQHEVLPTGLRVGSAVSVLVYVAVAVTLALRGGLLGERPPGTGVAAWVLTGYFVLGVGLNGISRSRSERAVMTPVCVVLAACALVVALS